MTGLCVLVLTACGGGTKERLGLVNTAPDEFSVVTRAPLSVPPDFNLRPPRPGAERPMEMSTQQQARQTVFGENRNLPTTAKSDNFLSKVGANEADANIRNVVDSETNIDNRTTAERLLFMTNDVNQGQVIDPQEEMQRLENEGVLRQSVESNGTNAAE